MSEENSELIYKFCDYQLLPGSRELLKSGNPINLSKKSFDILLLLIEKRGQVVSKEDILKAVWPNQIVTDAAFSKQMARLRNDLKQNQDSSEVIIETVRGIGVRLVPKVGIKSEKSSKSYVLFWLAPIVTILLLYAVNEVFHPKTETHVVSTPNDNKKLESFSLVVMPANKSTSWLNVGGLNYLSEQLQMNQQIETVSPRSQWFKNNDTQTLAINMSQNDGIDYVLTANNFQKDKNYIADLVLRSNDGIVAKETIQARGVNVLFDKINSWVIQQLNISKAIDAGQISGYQTTDFVLESYLRGREVAIHKSYEKARQLLQTATSQDSEFVPAWMTLAEIEARLGNNEKAMAIIHTITNRSHFKKDMLNKILVLKANFLVGMNQLKPAQEALENSIKLSEQKNDFSTLIDAITIKTQIDFNSGKVTQKTIDLLKKQITLLTEHKPDPYLLALAYFNLSASFQSLGQMDQAIVNAKLCIDLNTKANNIRGIVIGNSLLARIYKDLGNTGMALLTLENIEGFYEQMDGVDEQQIFLQYKTESQIYHGFRDEALKTIERLESLSVKYSRLETKIVALSLSFELNVIHKQFDLAKFSVKQMLKLLKQQSQEYPPIYNDLILAYDMFIAALVDDPKIARQIVKKNLTSNPNIKTFFEKELRMIEARILTKEKQTSLALQIYHELVDEYIQANQIQEALHYAGYPILDIQWQNNMQDYVKTMNYLDEIAVFKYPIDKYKARYLAYNEDYANAYVIMEHLKSKANQFWTAEDQKLLEEYQQAIN